MFTLPNKREVALNALVEHIEELLSYQHAQQNDGLYAALDAAELQPTTSAAHLAAIAAVAVLVAHSNGQTVIRETPASYHLSITQPASGAIKSDYELMKALAGDEAVSAQTGGVMGTKTQKNPERAVGAPTRAKPHPRARSTHARTARRASSAKAT